MKIEVEEMIELDGSVEDAIEMLSKYVGMSAEIELYQSYDVSEASVTYERDETEAEQGQRIRGEAIMEEFFDSAEVEAISKRNPNRETDQRQQDRYNYEVACLAEKRALEPLPVGNTG